MATTFAPLDVATPWPALTDAPAQTIELSIVIPTFEERPNIPVLIERLASTLGSIGWEAIFVDDHSLDGTARLVRDFARADRRIRVIERIGRRGLSSACIEGMMAASAPYIAVMDADLQHDETLLPRMLDRIQSAPCDVVVASRNCDGGSMGQFNRRRTLLSHLGRRISQLVCHCQLSDAMSGFFVVEAEFFRTLVPRLTGTGFKILVDILASSSTPPRIAELPYCFRMRQAGESKLDINVKLEYLYLVLDKLIGRWVPTRFALFLCVGALGVAVHLAVLALLFGRHLLGFAAAQAVATLVAMTSNFLLNNIATFRAERLRGVSLALGLLKFYAACSLGASINLAFASFLMREGVSWLLAGACGTAISSVWNYGVNTVFTWRRARG